MIHFPNVKINIGLNIIEKRPDGFHNIETVFYPVKWEEAVEVIENGKWKNGSKVEFSQSGLSFDGRAEDNLCVKAYNLLNHDFNLPPVKMYLHKMLPVGAGLGGGSSDAAETIKILNKLFRLELSQDALKKYASALGSDCTFFLSNKPVYARGKGDIFESVNIDLSGWKILIVKPPVHSNTAQAYQGVQPAPSSYDLKSAVSRPVETWRGTIMNDFEKSIFSVYPEVGKIKEDLYRYGASYASMSGSGSAVFGLFKSEMEFSLKFPGCTVFQQQL